MSDPRALATYDVRSRAMDLRDQFVAAGAQVVDPPVLQSAELLLDLYGEDIRARAYVTSDAMRGEQMLRPDFTVPVVQMHMAHGAEPARYTYAGEVFRRQETDPDRPSEYLQVGYEVFDRTNPAAADAEVFSLISQAVAPLGLRAATGGYRNSDGCCCRVKNVRATQGSLASSHLAAAAISRLAGSVWWACACARKPPCPVERARA